MAERHYAQAGRYVLLVEGRRYTTSPNAFSFSVLPRGNTLAERVAVPTRNLVDKPPALSFEEAACLPTAWLTAHRMLFTRGRVGPGDRVLVQGAGGGVATAAVVLAADALSGTSAAAHLFVDHDALPGLLGADIEIDD
jgi:NADPH:quinone reductase-like Zn-dependent oxidoreductase